MRLLQLSLALLGLLPPAAALAAAPAPERINVVFILADDLGWAELGSYGQRKIPTPSTASPPRGCASPATTAAPRCAPPRAACS